MNANIPLVFHVTHEPAGWCLWLAGGTDTVQHFARKEDAVRVGIRHAQATAPSQLLVHAADGTLELTKTFERRQAPNGDGPISEYFLGRGAVESDDVG